MRKICTILAAMAALVGCSKDNHIYTQIESNLTANASIVTESSRLSIGGSKYTDVSWEQGDIIRVVSDAGFNGQMKATAAGSENVHFKANSAAVAQVDSYYAVYPDLSIVSGQVTIDHTAQSGDDVAVLAAQISQCAPAEVDLAFKPINALLHISVSGKTEIAKAEFLSYTGKSFAGSSVFTFADEQISHSGAVESYSIDAPNTQGFFFSLPAGLDMSEGYVVRLTDSQGKICSKAYSGKVFEKGSTTRVAIEWATPSVRLGAKSSYSYYTAGDISSANSCANNVIYFNDACASTYHGIQSAFVTEVGFVVDGKKYSSADGAVAWNKQGRSFSINNITTTEQRSYLVEAYVVTKEHGTLRDARTIYITGLPYLAEPMTEDMGWSEVSWNVSWRDNYVKLGDASGSGTPAIISPKFVGIPTTISTKFNVRCTIEDFGLIITTFFLQVDGQTFITQKGKKWSTNDYNLYGDGTMTTNSQIRLESDYNASGPNVKVHKLEVLYR